MSSPCSPTISRQIAPTDAEIASHFDARKETYRVRIAADSIRADQSAQLAAKTAIPRADVERTYNERISTYDARAVRASHILLTTEGKDDAAVGQARRSEGSEIGRRLRGARRSTRRTSQRADSGDLDYFSRGRMVPDRNAAFALKPGDIWRPREDRVRLSSSSGGSEPAIVRPLSDPAL
jgi:parvulin-like peptidyl-prolyl isomerase